MAKRYLGLISEDEDVACTIIATGQRCGLQVVLRRDRVLVLASETEHAGDPESRRVAILGQAFARDGRRHALLPDDASLADIWGAYVAVGTDSRGFDYVVRDPSAAMPCYYARRGNGVVFASDVDLLVAASAIAPAVNWENLGWHIALPGFHSDHTCLDGVFELPRGCDLRFAEGGPRIERRWSPWKFANDPLELGDAELAEMLHETVCRCVASWSACFNRVALTVSGGLDSSVVAAALPEQSRNCVCITFVTDDSRGDERHYVRLLADALGLEVIECAFNVDRYDLACAITPYLPRPIGNPNAQLSIPMMWDSLETHSCSAVFNGGGGDNVFCSQRSIRPLVDRIRTDVWGAAQTLDDLHRLTGASYWQLAANLRRRSFDGTLRHRLKPATEFLAAEYCVEAADVRTHPWLTDVDDTLPGKTGHVSSIAVAHNYMESDLASGRPQFIAPLLSQPVIELCLRIPSWKWCRGGRDRVVARNAFKTHLPDAIVNRRWKGTPTSVSHEVFARHRLQIRDILHDGLLARHGIIDRVAIERHFAGDRGAESEAAVRLLMLADAEAWAQSWTARRARTNAPLASVAG